MDDNNLKKFLQKNSKVPSKPANEWANILTRIESKKTFSFLNCFKIERLTLGVVSMLVLVVAGKNIYRNQEVETKLVSKKKLELFLTSESYFDEDQAEYAWIDTY
jgi:flagella basal body P-ring formation protein FlgA